MTRIVSKTLLAILAIFFFSGVYHSPAFAQTPTPPSSKDILISKIVERAERDAKNGKAMEDAQGLSLLFGSEANTVGMTLLDVVDIYENAYLQSTPKENWWDPLKSFWGGGLLALIVTALVALLKDNIQLGINNLSNYFRELFLKKLNSNQVIWRSALKRYKAALSKKYNQISIQFRPDRPLNMEDIYVSLNLRGINSSELINEQNAIHNFRRLMIIGAPGSGKSMILKKIVLSFAENRTLNSIDQNHVPVLLDLNRLSDSDKSVFEHLVEIFHLNDFPHAEKFIEAQLGLGNLMLLFDGLDEVASGKRFQVIQKIKDFLDEHDSCRAIITCRTAVYDNEFVSTVDKTFELTEFSDQQIHQYLIAWEKDMPPGKSIEALIRNLHERPRIMALARNPLLLTIIAYLYTDVKFELPHSRTEFYEQSVDILLRQWKKEQNQYSAPQKRLVLQHLAKFNQDKGSAENQNDRRSIDITTVLAEIKRVLPDLNLDDQDAQPLLEEIEKRSGLLISIDGGNRYQFAHLTLQEFFAALAISGDDDILKRFKDDPDAWRETTKLWCGLEHDSTSLISEIFKIDPVTAFECLADAQKVSSLLTDKILEEFKVRILEDNDVNSPILKAFAAVAADQRPRGKDVLNFLETLLVGEEVIPRQNATIALSLTNQPRAAELLARYSNKYKEARTRLLQMGDLAIPELRKVAFSGNLDVINDIASIKTPNAAYALVPLLWNDNENIASSAAYNLSKLLRYSGVEERLRFYPLLDQQKNTEFLWVWEPFEANDKSSLLFITGRIMQLLEQGIKNHKITDLSKVDPRILIPLHLNAQIQSEFNIRELTQKVPEEEIANIINNISLTLKTSGSNSIDKEGKITKENIFKRLLFRTRVQVSEGFKVYYQILTGKVDRPGDIKSKESVERYYAVRHTLSSLANANKNMVSNLQELQNSFIQATIAYWDSELPMRFFNFWADSRKFEIYHRLLGEPAPSRDDWRNIFKPVKYQFKFSRHYWTIIIVMTLISFIFGYGLIVHFATISSLMKNVLEIEIPSLWNSSIKVDNAFFNFLMISYPAIFMVLAWAIYISPDAVAENRILIVKLLFLAPIYLPYLSLASFREFKKIGKNTISDKILRPVIMLILFFAILLFTLISLCIWIIFYFGLSIYIRWNLALGLTLVLGGLLFYNLRIGERRDREARNPLHGILDS